MKIFVFRDIRQINELITCKNPVSHQQQQQSNFLEFTMIMYVIVIRLSGVCNHRSDEKVGRPRSGSPICLSRVRFQTELDKVFLPINHENYNFWEKKNSQVMKEKKENLR